MKFKLAVAELLSDAILLSAMESLKLKRKKAAQQIAGNILRLRKIPFFNGFIWVFFTG